MDTDTLIDYTAFQLKTAYCTQRSRAQSVNFFLRNDKWDKHFRKAAEICVSNGFKPSLFMEVQFFCNKPWPAITALGSARAKACYMDKRKVYVDTVRTAVNVQVEIYEALAKVRDAEELLNDSNLDFDPLFRYLVAEINELHETADRYRRAAIMEYTLCSEYDSMYGGMIPEWLRAQAQATRGSVVEGRDE